jgi:hypothetical protein
VVEVHKLVGFFVVACFTAGWLWGLVAWIARRDPGERFWVWVTIAQVVAGIQALIGVVVYRISSLGVPTSANARGSCSRG